MPSELFAASKLEARSVGVLFRWVTAADFDFEEAFEGCNRVLQKSDLDRDWVTI